MVPQREWMQPIRYSVLLMCAQGVAFSFVMARDGEIIQRQHFCHLPSDSRVAQGAYLEVECIRNVLSVSGTLRYAESGTT